jgi:hypothetical protein
MLARRGKIHAIKKGRQWLVEPDSLKQFALQSKARKRNQRQQLRTERRHERATAVSSPERYAVSALSTMSVQWVAHRYAVVVTLSLFCMVTLAAHPQLLTQSLASVASTQSANTLHAAFAWLQHRLAHPTLQSPGVGELGRAPVEPATPQFASLAGVDPASGDILIREADVTTMEQLFSDELVVTFSNEAHGTITPVFRSGPGAAYPFTVIKGSNEYE